MNENGNTAPNPEVSIIKHLVVMRLRVNHVMSVYEAICTQMKIREIRLSVQWKLIKKAVIETASFYIVSTPDTTSCYWDSSGEASCC